MTVTRSLARSRHDRMIAGVMGMPAGMRGTLVLNGSGVRIGFTVLDVDRGSTHVTFHAGEAADPRFRAAFEALTRGLQPIDTAA